MKKKQANNSFADLYQGLHPIDGIKYKHPSDGFQHGKEIRVAIVPKEKGGDGQTCHVYETRLPATFFRIKVLAGSNSIGEPKPGYTLGFGSGQRELVGRIALAIAEGMLDFETK